MRHEHIESLKLLRRDLQAKHTLRTRYLAYGGFFFSSPSAEEIARRQKTISRIEKQIAALTAAIELLEKNDT